MSYYREIVYILADWGVPENYPRFSSGFSISVKAELVSFSGTLGFHIGSWPYIFDIFILRICKLILEFDLRMNCFYVLSFLNLTLN